MKINSYKVIRDWLPRFIIISSIVFIVLTLFFIYKNVWKIFSDSRDSALLQKEVFPAELEIDVFKKIGENLKNKKIEEKIDFEKLKNPFRAVKEEEIKLQ